MARKPRSQKLPEPWNAVWLAVGVAAVTFLLYWPSLWSGLVYDAEAEITIGTYIHNPAHFWEVITFQVMGKDVLDFNRPAHLFFLMTDSLVWGQNAFGYHLTSNLLHAVTAALLFVLLLRWLPQDFAKTNKARLAAALGALLFAVHPAQVEAVAQVTFREDQLAAFFLLLGLYLGTEFPGRTARNKLLLGIGCVFSLLLAAASKETGYIGPVLLGLYWLLYRRTEKSRAWLSLTVSALLVVSLFIAARFIFEPQNSEVFTVKPDYIGGSLAMVFELQPRLWAFLLWITVWPMQLSADYMPENLLWIGLFPALGVLLVVVLLQAFLSWKSRLAFFGSAIFWLGLAPVSNFIPIYRPMADRFLYLPLVGLGMIVCAVLAILAKKQKIFAGLVAAGFVIIVLLAALSWRREEVFANSLNLWRDTVTKSPTSSTAANNLGYAFLKLDNNEQALRAFQYSLQLTEDKKADSWSGVAVAFYKMGMLDKAVEAQQKAISLDARYGTPDKLVEFCTTDKATAEILKKINLAIPPG